MANQLGTLVNGQSYSFVNMTMQFSGVSDINPAFAGLPFKSISWNINRSKQANFENSTYATSYSYGKIEVDGSITFTKDTLEMIREGLAGAYPVIENKFTENSMVGLPAVDLIITYSVGGKANTVKLFYVTFTNEQHSGSEGDDQMNVTCDFIAARVSNSNKFTLSQVSLLG